MSLNVRKTLVFVTVIILLLTLQATNIIWSKEKSPAKPKKKSVTNHSNLNTKPEITKEKVYRIELKATIPQDYEFIQRLGLECVQDENYKCKANNRQLRELERSGYDFSIIEEGIQVKRLHSRLGLNSTPYDYTWGEDTTDVDIPDNDGWRYSDIEITDAPMCAQVTTIDVYFEINHTYIGDLVVKLTNEGPQYIEDTLWNRSGGSQEDLDLLVTDIIKFAGQPVNQTWKLWARDDSLLDVGYIDEWEILLYYQVKAEAKGQITYLNNWDFDDDTLAEVYVCVRDSASDQHLGYAYADTNGMYHINFTPTGNKVYVEVDFENILIASVWNKYDSSTAKEIKFCEDSCGGSTDLFIIGNPYLPTMA